MPDYDHLLKEFRETDYGHLLNHLISREAWTRIVYIDTRGNATGGVGHKMSESELGIYPVGSEVSERQIKDWLREDAERAWLAAYNQAKGIGEPSLRDALFSVCFQLGASWNRKFVKTWALLKDHRWEGAAVEVTRGKDHKTMSRWMMQTPIRVLDFSCALMALNHEDPNIDRKNG